MKEYLKMSDTFHDDVEPKQLSGWKHQGRYVELKAIQVAAAHAINSHDDLVAEVERLRLMISECYPYIKDKADWGNEYEVDLADRLFDAAK